MNNCIIRKEWLQCADNFSLLFKELDALHLTAFRYQRGELLQRLDPLLQPAEHLAVLRGDGVDGIYPDQTELYAACVQVTVSGLEVNI